MKDKARTYEVWANLALPIAVVLSGTVGWFTGGYVRSGGSSAAYIFLIVFALAAGAGASITRIWLRDMARYARYARFDRQYREMVAQQSSYWEGND